MILMRHLRYNITIILYLIVYFCWTVAFKNIFLALQVCIVELGGTIGDIEGMPFVEAFRQFQFRVKRENFCCAHVSLVPQVCVICELKFLLR